ncbi:hypothetical protein PLESTB_001630700 [Pleodorina starrii]|uniref:Uncharacterized protein n=1 Tax=Pleodorina starrii TaxID=330485 RepID=A0A9W6F9C1_9CHLO|nr:hypothetical protein PLESTM_000975600 [Pleodorina starrii]GLC60585.1 hypothetical protein PLESTB_001630700 [Pleodorina starrii]
MPLAQITPNAVDAYAATTQQLRIGQLTITSDDGLITAVSIFNGNAVTPFLNMRLVGRRATIQVVPSTPPQLADPGPHDYRILNERGTFQLEEQAADDADPEPADQGLPVVTPNITMMSPVDAPGQFHTAFVLIAERMDLAGDLDPDMAYDMPGLVLMKDVHGHFAADDSGYTFKVELPGRSDAQVANFTHKITTPAARDRIYYVFRSSRYAISGHPYYGGSVHAGVCTADMGNALHDILCIVFEKAPNILNLTGLYNHDITGYFIPNPNKTITSHDKENPAISAIGDVIGVPLDRTIPYDGVHNVKVSDDAARIMFDLTHNGRSFANLTEYAAGNPADTKRPVRRVMGRFTIIGNLITAFTAA